MVKSGPALAPDLCSYCAVTVQLPYTMFHIDFHIDSRAIVKFDTVVVWPFHFAAAPTVSILGITVNYAQTAEPVKTIYDGPARAVTLCSQGVM